MLKHIKTCIIRTKLYTVIIKNECMMTLLCNANRDYKYYISKTKLINGLNHRRIYVKIEGVYENFIKSSVNNSHYLHLLYISFEYF